MKNHNIRLSDKRLKAFLVKINNIKFYQFSSLMVNIQSPVSATVIKKTNKNNMHLKVVKLSLFWDDMIMYVITIKIKQKTLQLINNFSRGVGCNIKTEKSVTFLYTNNEQSEKKNFKAIPLEKNMKK